MQLEVWCQKYQQENIETNKIINMKLFTKADNAKLFANYSKGSDMANQNVVVKIFNPYGNGRWYIMNSDPNDPDYLWGIVDLGQGAEIGSISRSDLENYRNRFRFGFERDMSFRPRNAKEVLKGLNEGEYFDGGGEVEFIEYGEYEIMYEPHYKKYYANEMEFDNLEDAKKFIDSGEVPYFIKDAYAKGLFKKGGRLLSTRERYIAELKGLSGLQQKAIEDYIDENNLTSDEILHIVIGLGRKQISRSDVSTAIVGTKNNAESKKLLAFAMSKESLKAEYGAFMDSVYAKGGMLKVEDLKVGDYIQKKKDLNTKAKVIKVEGSKSNTKIFIEDIYGNKVSRPLDFLSIEDWKITTEPKRAISKFKKFTEEIDGYNLKDINGKKIEVGDTVKTTQPSGGLLQPADSEVGIVEKTKDAFGNNSLQIRYRKNGSNYDRLILLNGKDNEIVKKAYQSGGFMDGVYAGGGGVKRKMALSDSVIYQDKVWYITEKNGVVGLMNFKQGAWGSNYPFIPLSKISQSEITDMMGREVKIPYLVKDFAYGGDFPDVGETIKGSDIDYDMKDYFNRTNKKLIITTKDNKIHTGGSVGKFYNDLIFIAKDKFDIPVKDILKVKILK